MPRWTTEDLPTDPLLRATALQERAATLGFDWPDSTPVWDKLAEEIAELQDAAVSNDPDAIAHEWGDVLFSLVNLARFLAADPKIALELANARFVERLQSVQAQLDALGRDWRECSLDELELLWRNAKQQLEAYSADSAAATDSSEAI